ncbi:UNVERIFIED_CONTAM: hypothetical protein Sradi_2656300 [Sesamum radiatum]|uniref:Retrotransposon gag domain-containing protein n=1 Tax=Sesamum radiatum TaxID=300843 RepID=A0AAW2S5E0_SESRA
MADQTSLCNRVAELESQVQQMLELLGQAPESPPVALFPLVDTLHSRVETLQKTVGEWPEMLDKRVMSAIEEASILTDAVDVRVDGVQAEAARIPEAEKVSITSMYLTGDAKLWWRTRLSDDASANRDRIETWDVLKKELKDEFLPCNTSWLATESLRKLKHAGTVRDYVKEFSSLMLDVRDMSEEDKLFNFLSGLQTWAQTGLRRQSVKDLPSAISAADRLVDFRVTNNSDPEKKNKDSGKEKGKSGKAWKDGKFKKKKHQEITGSGNKETVQSNFDRTKKGCYLCNGDHRMRDCPKRGKLNALVAEADDEEGGSPRVNPLQLVSALQEQPPTQKGLMYVRVQINGKAVMAMLDSGATHNFVADREIQKLRLTLTQHSSRIKAVNSEAKPIQGAACVELKVGAWTGQCKLLAVPLDDFDVILGMDFMLLANAMGTYLEDSVRATEKKDSLMSAMQVKAGLKRGDQTYLAALIEIKPDVVQEVPDEVAELLQEFKDVFPPELPKKLPPQRAIDHAIELEPGARPPA